MVASSSLFSRSSDVMLNGLISWQMGSALRWAVRRDIFCPIGLCPSQSVVAVEDLTRVRTPRSAISRRTEEALAVAKARGVKLGNPNGAAALRRAGKGGVALRDVVSANADGFAAVIKNVRAAGHESLSAIASELTARGIRTRRGGAWGLGNVKVLLGRLDGSGKSSGGAALQSLSQFAWRSPSGLSE